MRVPSRATSKPGHIVCPACSSRELRPLEASRELTSEYRGQAYWCGWIDGRFGETECFTENLNLVRHSAPSDRLNYYRGHRAGSEARQANNSREAARLSTTAKGG